MTVVACVSLAACGREVIASGDASPPDQPTVAPLDRAPASADQPAADARLEDAPEASRSGIVVTTGVGARSATCAAASSCAPGAVPEGRETTCGTVTVGGSTIAVPAPIAAGPVAQDLYETCVGRGLVADWDSRVEAHVVDPDGELVTGYLFADNYFELSVNGRLVARDALGFTPFNASVVRFRARYPMTLAVRLVDWEGYLGVGLESRGTAVHIGDGGFIAAFSNGLVTSSAWRCRPVYISPLDDPRCLVEDADGNVDSSACPSTDATVRCLGDDPTRRCRAAHAPIPADWASPTFDDGRWPAAARFDAARVTNDPAYATFAASLFASAQFIWSRNLDLDNQVLCRVTLAAP